MILLKRKFLFPVFTILLCFGFAASAADFRKRDFLSEDWKVKADKWSLIGNNIVLEGNVIIQAKRFYLSAQKVVINDNQDLETFGPAKLISRKIEETTLTPKQLAELKKYPDVVVDITGVGYSPTGVPSLNAIVYYVSESMSADKLSGNLRSGYLAFENARCRMQNLVFNAKSGVRQADGNVVLKGADFSACEYLEDDNAHYSFSASEAKLYTHQNNGFDVKNYDFSIGQHSIFAKNAFANIYGIPVLWLPLFYKPKDESPELFHFSIGATSDWGFYISLNRKIDLTDYPYSSITLLADYYAKRGFGYGAEINAGTENSKTNIFAYGIYDTKPYGNVNEKESRFDIPFFRYDVRFTNVSHITPDLDFRAYVEFMSDPYIQHDYFRINYNNNPEPASYIAFERRFDYFTTSLYSRFQTNSFFTTAQKLPEYRIDVPRLELFGTNLYYQGQHSIDYLSMRWRRFAEPSIYPDKSINNYSTFRLDTTNFLYYPLKLDWLNILPRAGVRMTYYSNTSEKKVSSADLSNMFIADMSEGDFPVTVNNYGSSGSGKVRFIGEFGVEMNTKISKTYQNIRSELFGLDGLRHIMVPYLNYTYITPPSVDRDYLYYFDDTDRITKQNFFRFGLKNRLQTRSNNRLINTFSMENYWDLFVEKEDGFNNVGDFCTKLTAEPLKGLIVSTLFSINAGGNDRDRAGSFRNNQMTERKGITGFWLNRWVLSLSYEPIEDFIFNVNYAYEDNYSTRSVYSMGSSLTDLESGSAFDKTYSGRTQLLSFGVGIPLTPDRRTKATYQIMYDFEAGYIRNQRIGLTHRLHCWEFALILAQSTNWSDYKKETDYSISFNATVNGVRNPLKEVKGEIATRYLLESQNNIIGGI